MSLLDSFVVHRKCEAFPDALEQSSSLAGDCAFPPGLYVVLVELRRVGRIDD